MKAANARSYTVPVAALSARRPRQNPVLARRSPSPGRLSVNLPPGSAPGHAKHRFTGTSRQYRAFCSLLPLPLPLLLLLLLLLR